MRIASTFVLALCLLGGCGGDDMDHSSTGKGPNAPSELAAVPLTGGAHLTWKDNSSNEENFMVLRQQMGTDADYKILATLPFDSVQYHDGPLTPGATYSYKIMAMNGQGESESNVVMLTAP
jgi:hypothetical protein